MTEDRTYDDGPDEADEFVRGVRDRYIERSDAAFDFAAGLADVYLRAGLPALPSAADICVRIDALASLLDVVERLQGPASRHVRQAREGLFELRHAVTTRPRPWTGAGAGAGTEQLLHAVADHLDRADRFLREHSGMSLDELIRQCLGDVLDHPVDTASELRTLRGQVTGEFGVAQSSASARPPRTRNEASPEARNRHRP